jgi:ParB-like chromosome segregation protein Spo0J
VWPIESWPVGDPLHRWTRCQRPGRITARPGGTKVRANDYNPNRVAAPEIELLELSMRADGVTMPAVVVPDGDGWRVVDGFHRRKVITERLGAKFIPCSVIDRPLGDRMASTIRHNRARGKHQVDLMADIVRKLLAEGWEDDKIAEHVGMSAESQQLLRQMTGAAKMLAGSEYSQSWGVIDGDISEDPAR